DSDVIGDRPCKSTSPSKGLDHGVGHPIGLRALHKRLRIRGRGLGPMRSSLLACAFPCGSPHRMTTMRAPGQTLHHGPRVICAKRATHVEILRQSCKEVKKTWEKVSPSCGIHKWPTR